MRLSITGVEHAELYCSMLGYAILLASAVLCCAVMCCALIELGTSFCLCDICVSLKRVPCKGGIVCAFVASMQIANHS